MNTTKHQKKTSILRKPKHLLLIAVIALGSGLSTVKAQVGIGTIIPNVNAVLDLTATNKGFLPPRVALTSRDVASPIGVFVPGMIVYNTQTAGTAPNKVKPGFYYSNGTRWVRVQSARLDQTVDVSGLAAGLSSPNTFAGATYAPNTPSDPNRIYINTTDGTTWTYDPVNKYESFEDDPSTPFYLANGTVDAGSNKTTSIYRNGNIGIGISTPHAPLQFSNGLANRKIVLYEGANNDHQFYGLGMGSFELRYQVQYPGNHVFYTSASTSASTELMRITSLGRVGIHNVANPFNELEVNGTLAVGAAYVGNVLAPANGAIIQGNVGIGTTTPNAPLQFANSLANRKIVMYENANDDNQYYGFGISSGVTRYQVANTGSAHAFYAGVNATTSNELVRITGAGNVGINTNIPIVKLQIDDNVTGTGTGATSLNINNISTGPAAVKLYSMANATLVGQNGDEANGALLPNAAYWGAPAGGHDFQIITKSLGSTPATAAITIKNATNYIGLGTTTPNAPLQFANALDNRKIVLWEDGNNDHQYFGFGINGSVLRYQTPSPAADHVFYSGINTASSTELMRITGDGKVGIDVSAPHAPLQFSNDLVNRKVVLYEGGNNDHNYYGFGVTSGILRYQVGGSGNHVFYCSNALGTASLQLMTIGSTGNVAITGSCTATSFPVSSDARFKNNIQSYGDIGLTQIMALKPKTYTYKSDLELKKVMGITPEDKDRWSSKIGMPQGNQFGFIAQEVEQVIPQVVITDEKGFKGVDYGHLTPVLVKAIQEQQAQITALQNKVAEKDERITVLEAKEAAYAQLAAEVKEMRQMLGMKKTVKGNTTAKR